MSIVIARRDCAEAIQPCHPEAREAGLRCAMAHWELDSGSVLDRPKTAWTQGLLRAPHHEGFGKSPCGSIWSTYSSSSRWPTSAASRRRRPRPSGARLGQRADQGPRGGARRLASEARPPRRRAHRGRRKPARSRAARHPQCRGDARRPRRLRQRRPGQRPPARQYRRGCRSICRRRSPPSCASIPISMSTSRNAKASTSPLRSRSVRPISALPPSMRCPTMSSGSCSARTA